MMQYWDIYINSCKCSSLCANIHYCKQKESNFLQSLRNRQKNAYELYQESEREYFWEEMECDI